MTAENRQIIPRLLITITREDDQRRIEEVFDSMHLPIWCQCRGKGTASSEMLDIFGLCGTTRLITVGLVPKEWVKIAMAELGNRLALHKKGHGIAVAVPVTGLQGHVLRLLQQEACDPHRHTIEGEETAMKETSEYAMLWVSVASGYSDEVIDAARDAGARGGTVIKGRRRSSDRASQYFGISTQEEQDFVMIIVPRTHKAEIMSVISKACGLQTPAQGMVLSLPIEDALGLET